MLESCRDRIDRAIAPLLTAGGSFALVDFPDYGNVGDSAIWLGELGYFRDRHDATPAYVSTHTNFSLDALRRAVPSGPLFITGGGNLGTLWPRHQRFRETILDQVRDRPVVQLPQSIHFETDAELKRFAGLVRRHPNFVLLVRDHRSYTIAENAFDCETLLCPDMALWLGKLPRNSAARRSLLLLIRGDKEARVDRAVIGDLPVGAAVMDWIDEDEGLGRKVWRRVLLSSPTRLRHRVFDQNKRREFFYRRLAEARLDRGVEMLSSSAFVVTDRLHGHILSTLLSLPHVALDNSYGKLSSFIQSWTKELDTFWFCQDLTEAMAQFGSRGYRS